MTYHLPTLISVKSRGDVERDDVRIVQSGGLNNSRKVSFLTYDAKARTRNLANKWAQIVWVFVVRRPEEGSPYRESRKHWDLFSSNPLAWGVSVSSRIR